MFKTCHQKFSVRAINNGRPYVTITLIKHTLQLHRHLIFITTYLSQRDILINEYCLFMYPFSDIYRSKNILKNFNEFLTNLFMPLYEVSINPKSHEKLHKFLQQVSINLHNVIYILK